jgi:thymidylate synthase
LGENLTNRYNEILDFIRGAGFGSAPISPIDYMHSELRKAGYKTEEITGRTITLNYESGKPLLTTRSANIKQRVNAVKSFNGGVTDVIILNQAGSTGLSLHASNKFKDQRKRHMIIVQAEKNIDTHMQMLGRVLRTGQVVKPAYSQMMGDIPAEMRPAAVLLKKMASLSANTTASRKSAVSAEGAVDFMNEYGGQVAQEYLRDNPDVYQDLGGEKILQIKENSEDANEEDIRKLTGYIPILPIKQQEEVYKDLIERYNDLIEREDSMGTNKLEAKAMDLDAQTVSSKAITEDKGESSIFAQPAYMERVDVKRTVKPYSKAEVQELVKDNKEKIKDDPRYTYREIDAKAKAYADEQLLDAQARGADPVRIASIEGQIRTQREHVKTILINYGIGSRLAIKNTNGVFVYGVVTDIENKGKTKNPVAGSDWKMTLALANGDAKSLNLTFSQIGTRFMLNAQDEVQYLNPDTLENERIPLMDLFDRGATVRREKRWMVTGNILAGFAEVNNMGQIISYTKNDGTTSQGVLMPRTFDFEKELKNAPIRLKTYADVKEFFDKFGRGAMVTTPDAVLRIKSEGYGTLKFVTSSAKREGDDIAQSSARSIAPLGIAHGVGVVFDGAGQAGLFAEQLLERDVLPAGDVGEFMHEAMIPINQARHAHTDGCDACNLLPKHGNALSHSTDQSCGSRMSCGGNGLVDVQQIGPSADAEFHGGAAEVDADGDVLRVLHEGCVC